MPLRAPLGCPFRGKGTLKGHSFKTALLMPLRVADKCPLTCDYCCEAHSDTYAEHFHWPEASAAALKRAGGKCADCPKEAKSAAELRVHHIEPLNGELRLWNILNRPENLLVLCPSCHGKRHAELNGTRRLKRPEQQLRAGQLLLFA